MTTPYCILKFKNKKKEKKKILFDSLRFIFPILFTLTSLFAKCSVRKGVFASIRARPWYTKSYTYLEHQEC